MWLSLQKCQILRRNGDDNATKVFIGLRHPLGAKIQVINVNDSLYRVKTLSLSFPRLHLCKLQHIWNLVLQLRQERSSRSAAPYHE